MSQGLHILPYAMVVFLGALSPGPDFALVTRHAALNGRRAGVAAGIGIGGGMAINTMACLAGVGAVIAASSELYTGIRLAGAAYLMILGVRALLALRERTSGGTGPVASSSPEPAPPPAAGRPLPAGPPAVGQAASGLPVREARPLMAFRQGLLTNILNPKAIVFLVALMPQFLPAQPSTTDRFVLGAVTIGVTLSWFVLVALAVSALRKAFQRPLVRRALNAVTGTVLVALGVRLAIS